MVIIIIIVTRFIVRARAVAWGNTPQGSTPSNVAAAILASSTPAAQPARTVRWGSAAQIIIYLPPAKTAQLASMDIFILTGRATR
jgi:hypothetical protein